MSQNTAGKGPGLVMRAANHSGICKVSLAPHGTRALLEVLEVGGRTAEIGLTAAELRQLAQALLKVALALTASSLQDDTTAH